MPVDSLQLTVGGETAITKLPVCGVVNIYLLNLRDNIVNEYQILTCI